MTKTSFIFAVILLVHSFLLPITSYANPPELSKHALKVRTEILKLGTGEEARLAVKLKDKTKLKGFIREAGEDHFILVETNSNREVTVPYNQVQQGKGQNLSLGTKIIVIATLALTALLILFELSLD